MLQSLTRDATWGSDSQIYGSATRECRWEIVISAYSAALDIVRPVGVRVRVRVRILCVQLGLHESGEGCGLEQWRVLLLFGAIPGRLDDALPATAKSAAM